MIPGLILMFAASALSGQLPNPLLVYARDDTEHSIRLSAEGALFEDELYLPVGKNRWRVKADDGTCGGDAPQIHEATLALTEKGVEVTRVERYRPCKGRVAVARESRRRFGFFHPPPADRCTPISRDYLQSQRAKAPATVATSTTATITDHCDGTATVSVLGASVHVSETRPGNFAGRALGASATLVGVPGAPTLSIRLKAPGAAAKGRWTLRE